MTSSAAECASPQYVKAPAFPWVWKQYPAPTDPVIIVGLSILGLGMVAFGGWKIAASLQMKSIVGTKTTSALIEYTPPEDGIRRYTVARLKSSSTTVWYNPKDPREAIHQEVRPLSFIGILYVILGGVLLLGMLFSQMERSYKRV